MSKTTKGGACRQCVSRLAVAFAVAWIAVGTATDAAARATGYTFTVLATLDTFNFANDFEPWSINNRGEVAFGADLPNTGGEAIYVADHGAITPIAQTGQAAPGGGTFDAAFLGQPALSDNGDVAFTFTLSPFTLPVGNNAGVYRFSASKQQLTAVVVPGMAAPSGGTFAGATFRASLNNKGDVAFTGLIPATIGPGAAIGLGQGIFRADKAGAIVVVVRPGDAAPGGGTFDFAQNAWINDGGDIAFGAHVAAEECIDESGLPAFIFCGESVYLQSATDGSIRSVAHQGDPAPGGGFFRLAFGPIVNNRGQVAFIGDLTTAPGFGQDLGVFLYTGGETRAIARPGDAMPGGGHLASASNSTLDVHLNDVGEVAFSAFLDTNSGGVIPDTGVYVGTVDSLRLVARSGTVIPGVGTIAQTGASFASPPTPSSGAANNARGQVFFNATLTDGRVVLLLATP